MKNLHLLQIANLIMADIKDYTQFTLEELRVEERKIKKHETLSAFLIGLSIGVLVYAVAVGNASFISILLPMFLIAAVMKNSKKQKEELKEIQGVINYKSR